MFRYKTVEIMKHDYWQWPSYLNTKQIKDINNYIDSSFFEKEPEECAALDAESNRKKFLETKLIPFFKLKNYLPNLWDIISATNLNNFGYDIIPFNDTCDSIHYNKYSSKTKDRYDWHVDGSKSSLLDIKFTVLINISNKKYTGGEFKLFNTNEYIVNELSNPGNMIMFRSYLNHKVEKVTSGERRTLALFIKGPAFR